MLVDLRLPRSERQRATVLRPADLPIYMVAASQEKLAMPLEDLVDCFIGLYFEHGFHGALLARFILEHRLHPSGMRPAKSP